ncbi:hypothetical protein [Actinoplanes sp. N902-109]|uniref:hypothetical protein n=1 Tax=Actinoplanes sp. (strain N902-109) TaxID=649831 RepID=UPI0003295AE4|nr:hypothetical protein [Actinoplanes sp. N902-109]AGL19945.1 hypothetical protein L083_6435 [Actinoplanes sp. N902-109]
MDRADLAYAVIIGLLVGGAGGRLLRRRGAHITDAAAILLAFVAAVLGSLLAGATGVDDQRGFEPVERLLQFLVAGATLTLLGHRSRRTPASPRR